MISIVETIFELIGASKTGLNVIPHGMNHLWARSNSSNELKSGPS